MRSLLLVSTALSLGVIASPSNAATCVLDLAATPPTALCSEPASDPVDSAVEGLEITVEAEASVVSSDRATPPLGLRGSGQSVFNFGTVSNGDTRNNTNAIEITGGDIRIETSGRIDSGDRAIHAIGGTGNIEVVNSGVIVARRQAVRTENDLALPNLSVTNSGTIESADGRAIQARGPGTRVMNSGELYGWEEVIEARDDFYLENSGIISAGRPTRDEDGTITGIERKADEDGVQFASGEVFNTGVIIGTDDGIDMDEGFVHNFAQGRILSRGPDDERNKAAIDIDAEFDNSRDPVRPGGVVRIVNEGLMEGPRAISTAYDPTLPEDDIAQSKQSVLIENSGTLIGRGGVAIGLAPTQGDSALSISGESRIYGDVIFGGGNDTLSIDALTSGLLLNSIFDGGDGMDGVNFVSYLLGDITGFAALADGIYDLGLQTVAGTVSAKFTNWETWTFGNGQVLTTREFAAAFAPPTAPVPLPAGLPLLVTGLGAIWLLRRRSTARATA